MILDRGYYIMNRFSEGFFSIDPISEIKIKMLYFILVEGASFRKDETYGIVNSASIKPIYSVFGRKNMSRYLKKLEQKGLIEILSKASNHFESSSIKIIHYQESQKLNKYGLCHTNGSGDVTPIVHTHVTDMSHLSHENILINNRNKIAPVTDMSHNETDPCHSNVTLPACSYIEEQNNRSNRIKIRVNSESSEQADINLHDPDSLALAPSKPVKKSSVKKTTEGKSIEVVNAYKIAYKSRYLVDPIINAATRSQACKLVDSVGKEVAPVLAQFYLTHNAQWYVRNLHKFGLLLSDAEKLHTEMQKGEYMTDTLARKADKQSHEQSIMDSVQQKIDSGFFNFDEE